MMEISSRKIISKRFRIQEKQGIIYKEIQRIIHQGLSETRKGLGHLLEKATTNASRCFRSSNNATE